MRKDWSSQDLVNREREEESEELRDEVERKEEVRTKVGDETFWEALEGEGSRDCNDATDLKDIQLEENTREDVENAKEEDTEMEEEEREDQEEGDCHIAKFLIR